MKLIDGTSIASSNRGTPIIGLCLAMDGFISLAERFFDDPESGMTYFLPYRLSQDHLELHFAKIRGRGHGEKVKVDAELHEDEHDPTEDNISDNSYVDSSDEDENETTDNTDAGLSTYQENISAYIAGFAVKKIQSKCNYCEECKAALVDKEKQYQDQRLQLIRMKDNGGLICPSESVLAIALVAEMVIRKGGSKPSTGKNKRKNKYKSGQSLES
ncbi:uncharacterized protein LOC121422644 [Lytechinus variegatus]|uniref:uncharacterized protein LOC121422644 n=1 Tax=Lytechinus variegatus TaxID=7654 RepID=UPI001BB0E05C|nr:uncharacterized protein LOC121422644 [Lytechinus variegatus]